MGIKHRWIAVCCVLGILLLITMGYALSKDIQHNQALKDSWSQYQGILQEVEVSRNHNQVLTSAISDLETNNNQLKSTLAELKEQPHKIKYITKIETVLVPQEPELVTSDLPEEYLFSLEGPLVAGRFSQVSDGYRFETFKLSFRNILVIGESKTGASLQAQSSFDSSTWIEIPVQIQVSKIKEQPVFEPHLGVGLTISPSILQPVTGSILVSAIHPLEDLDVLGLRLGFNKNLLRVGIDPIGYNLGKPLPGLTDTWIYPGVSIDTSGYVTADITIGSKF